MNHDFEDAVRETFKNCGLPPLIGTFAPEIGDIGQERETGKFLVWDGKNWLRPNPNASIIIVSSPE